MVSYLLGFFFFTLFTPLRPFSTIYNNLKFIFFPPHSSPLPSTLLSPLSKVSLRSTGCPGICFIDQADFKLRESPACLSCHFWLCHLWLLVLGLWIMGCAFVFLYVHITISDFQYLACELQRCVLFLVHSVEVHITSVCQGAKVTSFQVYTQGPISEISKHHISRPFATSLLICSPSIPYVERWSLCLWFSNLNPLMLPGNGQLWSFLPPTEKETFLLVFSVLWNVYLGFILYISKHILFLFACILVILVSF